MMKKPSYIWRDRYKIYFVFDRDDLQWIAAMDL